MTNVKMYTKPDCPYCAAAKKHYNDNNIEFDDINVVDNPEAQKEVLKLSKGQKIVPVVIDGDEVKIGWGGG